MEEQNQKLKYKLFGKIPVISLVGLFVGILGGYFYYAEIGCVSGSCAITSNPYMSMAWGGAMGYLVFDMFSIKKEKDN